MPSLRPLSCALAAFAVARAEPPSSAASASAVPLDRFKVHGDLEITLWAGTPLVVNPTNIDVDSEGRIWVAEGANYRKSRPRPEGDRIMVLEDSDGDGKADRSHVFVQEPGLAAPLGLAVIGNRVVVSMTPDLIVYTDVDGDRVFDPAKDRREVLLTGFEGRSHDHSLHAVTVGPDGWWYFNCGNMGGTIRDASGRQFLLGSPYQGQDIAGRPSADGHVYIGGTAFRMRPDGARLTPIGHNFRNSYEQTVTSFGDVFQNDNDDPPACRTTWLMEHGNLGFASSDGRRAWKADQRPGQDTPTAQWRQEDPGVIPAGDVYGGGAPCGIAFVENSALGPAHEGLLLSCESARNTVLGYFPKPDGAGFALDRFDFVTSNPDAAYAGTDFRGGKPSGDRITLFRPSDVVVGPDGAIYVSDWLDPRVGGHQTLDPELRGAIYRIAPKGFHPAIPKLDLATPGGAAEALCSPAIHVRAQAADALVRHGGMAIAPLRRLAEGTNRWFRARAIQTLARVTGGVEAVKPFLRHADPQTRIAAHRALLRAGLAPELLLNAFNRDPSPAVRREALLSLRDTPLERFQDRLPDLLADFDGNDRWLLEALGIACAGKESAAYAVLKARLGGPDPATWSYAFSHIAWRLHPPEAAPDLLARAMTPSLAAPLRKTAMDALAFIPTAQAATAMLTLATRGPEDLRDSAAWWVRHRGTHDWRDFGVADKLPKKAPVTTEPFRIPEGIRPTQLPPAAEIAKRAGNAKRGAALFAGKGLCTACHSLKGKGGDIGPELTGIGLRFGREALADALVNPSAGIALGYELTTVALREGGGVAGILLANGDPILVRSLDGQVHTIERSAVASVQQAPVSLMPPVNTLGLTAQEVADLLSHLQSLK